MLTSQKLKRSQSIPHHQSLPSASTASPSPAKGVLKRRSTGCLPSRRISTSSNKSIAFNISTPTSSPYQHKAWRPPGFYEIPNVLGSDCFLKPTDPITVYALRQSNPQKNISKRPWLPAGINIDIPKLPPLDRPKNTFERQLTKCLPKSICVSTLDPNNKYGNIVNGAVVGAKHRYKHCKLAIKRCKLDSDPDYRSAIIRELKIMASGHVNLIRLREVSIWRDDVWMVMDLQQCSVFAVLCQRGLPEEHTLYVAREILKALVFLHSKGYIHRDIKCENLLVGWHGEIKLADFGLATRISRRNRERLGTSKWMAPEVIREFVYNEKIDLWSLGITIIEMMDRVPPHYQMKNERQLFASILNEPSPTFNFGYPTVYMRGLVAWLLDDNPESRPSAKDVTQEIQSHIDSKLLRASDASGFAKFVTYVMPSHG
ncbi:kinase-like protein [Hesseltinella vesiculosa]|uniref:Kinase-like protein n=1 Tax=Hesseltinella vesiculosa TaxID=101127 RepID=A0A1X2GDP4_9FUNG|nr:kinase-like protein [Hesseltinella vesiculosa]